MSVYFATSGEGMPVKIGYSANPERRVAELSRAHNLDLRLIRVIDGNLKLERRFHAAFAHRRIEGEWFSFDPEMMTLETPPKAAPKMEQRSACLTDKQWRWLDREAKRLGVTVSEYLRGVVNTLKAA